MTQSLLLGVDIGGTKCAVVVATPDGAILYRASEPTLSGQRGPHDVLDQLANMARTLVTQAGATLADVKGVGVSCGGPLDTKTGVIHAPPNLPDWQNVPVKAFFENALGLPTVVENDANATALAEWRFGAGQGAQNLVFLTMGTGIGGGIIADGRLYRGTNDLAGEIGHQTILMNGPLCGCGKRGCLEALASGPAIARLARESLHYGRHKRVLALAGGKPADITAAHVVEAAKEGDPFARADSGRGGNIYGRRHRQRDSDSQPGTYRARHDCRSRGRPDSGADSPRRGEYAWPRSASVCEIVPAALGDRAQDLAAIALLLQ